MSKSSSYQFDPVRLIDEMKKRPGLYRLPVERDEKLLLWSEIGSSVYRDWDKLNKAEAYERVLELQRKWRCLRDAYNRELRSRRTGVRSNKREYIYFRRMLFLGGDDDRIVSDHEELKEQCDEVEVQPEHQKKDPLSKQNLKRARMRRRKSSSPESSERETTIAACHIEMPTEVDSDKLFLLSFLPEMRQLPPNIKMWARAKIANVMQEAVATLYNETVQNIQSIEVKSQITDNSD